MKYSFFETDPVYFSFPYVYTLHENLLTCSVTEGSSGDYRPLDDTDDSINDASIVVSLVA